MIWNWIGIEMKWIDFSQQQQEQHSKRLLRETLTNPSQSSNRLIGFSQGDGYPYTHGRKQGFRISSLQSLARLSTPGTQLGQRMKPDVRSLSRTSPPVAWRAGRAWCPVPLNWIELGLNWNWNELNWIELELNWNWNELNWIDLKWNQTSAALAAPVPL